MTEQAPKVKIEDLSNTMYHQMRQHAADLLRSERMGHTLSQTALVNEAIEKMLSAEQRLFNNRSHLMAAAALAMRRILVDYARTRGRIKRGSGQPRRSWDDVLAAIAKPSTDVDTLLDLDEAIEQIRSGPEDQSSRIARVAELRLFGAMPKATIAQALDVSLRTVEGDWKVAKDFLRQCLGTDAVA